MEFFFELSTLEELPRNCSLRGVGKIKPAIAKMAVLIPTSHTAVENLLLFNANTDLFFRLEA